MAEVSAMEIARFSYLMKLNRPPPCIFGSAPAACLTVEGSSHMCLGGEELGCVPASRGCLPEPKGWAPKAQASKLMRVHDLQARAMKGCTGRGCGHFNSRSCLTMLTAVSMDHPMIALGGSVRHAFSRAATA